MSKHSIYDQKTDLVGFDVKIAGSSVSDKVQIAGVSVYKSLNKISTAKIEIYDGDISSAEFETIENEEYVHGKEVEISLGYHNNKDLLFKGIIVKHTVKISSTKGPKIVLECADKAIGMTGQRKFDYYPNMKDSDIFNRIISIDKDVEGTDKTHEVVIQHNTSHWDFIVARAQANKMVVIADNNKVKIKKPNVGSPVVEITNGENIIDMDLSIDGKMQIKEIEAFGWSPKDQDTLSSNGSEPSNVGKLGNLKGPKIAGDLEYEKTELHSTANLTTEELKAWADSRLLLSRMSRVRGIIKTQGVKVSPMETIELKSLGKYYDGKVYVSGVFHEQKEGNWTTEIEVGIKPDLFVQQKTDINLPIADGLFPGSHGLTIGKVVKVSGDPEGEFRVKVRLPMVKGLSGEGVWARVSNVMATKDYGSFFYPEVDDEVVVGTLGGDLRFPIILGHLYSSKRPYPESKFRNSENNYEKGWFTKGELLFHFDDNKKIVKIETPGGQKFRLDDDKKEIVLEDQHNNKMVMGSDGFKFTGNKNFKIDISGKVDIKTNGETKINSSVIRLN